MSAADIRIGGRRRGLMLGVLALALAFNFFERQAFWLVSQDIKVALKLSDTELGLLNGIAFAFFYVIMGLVIARWADRGNRVRIIAITTGLWGIAVALCGAANNFTQLLLIRVLVAVGEAGCLPPSQSLLADYYTRAERPRAVARYMLGIPLSGLIGFFLAGWLAELFGWRMMFVALGLLGLPLALLIRTLLVEPRAEPAARAAAAGDEPLPPGHSAPGRSIVAVGRHIWRIVSFRQLLIAFALMTLFNSGVGAWNAVYFIRTYGLSTTELGTWFSAIYGVGGVIGMLLSGEIAARLAANNERLQLRLVALAYALVGLLTAGIYLAPSLAVAFAFTFLTTATSAISSAPIFAATASLVPAHMRATSVALMYLVANLVGGGLGPLIVGLLSDHLHALAGEASLRYALVALCPGYLWVAFHLLLAARAVGADMRRAVAAEPAAA